MTDENKLSHLENLALGAWAELKLQMLDAKKEEITNDMTAIVELAKKYDYRVRYGSKYHESPKTLVSETKSLLDGVKKYALEYYEPSVIADTNATIGPADIDILERIAEAELGTPAQVLRVQLSNYQHDQDWRLILGILKSAVENNKGGE